MPLFAALLAVQTVPSAPPAAAADPYEQVLGTALSLSRAGRVAEASRMIDPVLAGYRAKYAAEERRLYCDFGVAETKRYLLGPGTETVTARAIPKHWCVALFLKAYALNDRRDFAGALPYLQQAVGMAPAHAHFLNELGYTLQQLGQAPAALDAFTKAEAGAVATAPTDALVERTRALRGMGAVLVELGRWDEAEAAYRRSLALDPSDARARAELDWIAKNRPATV